MCWLRAGQSQAAALWPCSAGSLGCGSKDKCECRRHGLSPVPSRHRRVVLLQCWRCPTPDVSPPLRFRTPPYPASPTGTPLHQPSLALHVLLPSLGTHQEELTHRMPIRRTGRALTGSHPSREQQSTLPSASAKQETEAETELSRDSSPSLASPALLQAWPWTHKLMRNNQPTMDGWQSHC